MLNTVQSSPGAASAYLAGHSQPTAGKAGGDAPYMLIRRNGAVVSFEPVKIAVAMMKAFLAVHGTQGAASSSVRETVDELTQNVVRALMRSRPGGGTFHIEDVQDQVELGLMRGGHRKSPAPTCSTVSAAPKSVPPRKKQAGLSSRCSM